MMMLKIAGEQVSSVKNSLDLDFALTYEIDQLKCQVITDTRPSHEASIAVYDTDFMTIPDDLEGLGSFEADDLTGWTGFGSVLISSAEAKDGEKSLKVVSAGTSDWIEKDVPATAGDVIYLCGGAYNESVTSGGLYLSLGDYEDDTYSNLENYIFTQTEGKWLFGSVMMTAAADGYRVIVGTPDAPTLITYADNVRAYNLTKIYGAGNIPAQNVMDGIAQGMKYSGTITNVQEVDITAGIWDITALDNTREMGSLLVVEEYTNQSASNIATDLLSKYAPAGFSAAGIKSGAPVIEFKQFSDKRLSECLKELCDYVGWQWYVDAHKVVHFFNAEEILKPAPFVLGEANRGKIFDFRLSINTENIRNRIKVNGGSMLSDAQNFPFVYDGVMRAWSPPYKPHELKIYVSEVLKTVGIENIDDPSTVDFLLNYQEERITMGSAYVSPAQGTIIRQNLRYPMSVVTVVENFESQQALAAITGETGDNAGVREDVINDDTIVTLGAAEALGNAALRKWADPEISASFSTYTTGWEPGQLLVVNLPSRGLVNTYMVQKVNMAYRNQEWITEVRFGGRLVSVADFLQALVSKQQSATVQTAILQKFSYGSEKVGLTDELVLTSHTGQYICGDPDAISGLCVTMAAS